MTRFFSFLVVACCIIFFSCQKEVSSETGGFLPAEGSLSDSSGNCLPSTVHGTFYTGVTPGRDTAYVEIEVNVTKTGSYSITSDFQNGLQFLDSGFFSNTGLNIIRLKPIGTPILIDSTVFNFAFDSSFCSFIVSIEDSTGRDYNSGGTDTTGTGKVGTWQFSNDSSGFFQGTFYTAVSTPDTIFGGTDLGMFGFTATGDSVLTLTVIFPGNAITTGTYSTQIAGIDTHATALFGFNFVNSGEPIYDAVEDPSAPSNVTITITSYDASTKIVTGTFSGTAMDEAYSDDNATIQIVNGSFTAKVQ